MKIFDTHAHYDSRQFSEDRDEILKMLRDGSNGTDLNEAGDGIPEEGAVSSRGVPVGRIVNVGADMASSYTTLELAGKYDFIYAAVGVHPDSAGELIWCPEKCEGTDNVAKGSEGESEEEDPYRGITEETCKNNREKLKGLSQENKVVAIGEIGLDYHWDIWPRDIQQKAFEFQWRLAAECGLPVIIHSRDAAEDTLRMITDFYREADRAGGVFPRAVMHCYSYSPEHAEEYLKMGLMFGIGGVVTFKNAKKLKEVVDLLPLDRILLETDCPYMAPDPFRGKRNNSGYLTYVAGKIAEIKGMDVKEVYKRTWENAEMFFAGKGNIYGNTRGSEKNDRNTQ